MFKLGFRGGLSYESTPFVLRQYYPFGRSKYSTAQTTLRQLKDNLNYIYIQSCDGADHREDNDL